jgi:hypothetical protein
LLCLNSIRIINEINPLVLYTFLIDLSGHVGTTPLHCTITVSLIYRCFTLLTRLYCADLNKWKFWDLLVEYEFATHQFPEVAALLSELNVLRMHCMFSNKCNKILTVFHWTSLTGLSCFLLYHTNNPKSVAGYRMWSTSLWTNSASSSVISCGHAYLCMEMMSHWYIQKLSLWAKLKVVDDFWTMWFSAIVTGRSLCLNWKYHKSVLSSKETILMLCTLLNG